jgi:predicted Zn-dependent protease
MAPASEHWLFRGGRIWLLLASLAALACAAGAACIFISPYYHLHAAEQALRTYDFDAAQQHLDACLQSWPKSCDVQLMAARTARRRSAYDEADRHLAECERIQGSVPATARERALMRVQQGELTDVEAPLRDLVKQKDPDAPLVLEALARGYFVNNRVAQTIDCLDLLLDQQPDHFPARMLRGRVLESLPDDDEAVKDYEHAVSLRPTSAEARLRYADALSRLGRTSEAVGQYECLRQRPPVLPEVVIGLARCRYDLNDADEARRLLDGLLADHPDHVAGLVEHSRLALHADRPADAERDLRRAVELSPFERDALLVLGRCLEEQGKGDEARDVQARRGLVEGNLKRITNLKAKVGDYPHDPDLRRQIGVLYLGLGEDDQGLGWLASALTEDPRHAPTHAALADYYERVGQQDEAARHRRLARAASGS